MPEIDEEAFKHMIEEAEMKKEIYDKKYEVLVSTSIIESGIDIPGANTLFVNRADQALYAAKRAGRNGTVGWRRFVKITKKRPRHSRP